MPRYFFDTDDGTELLRDNEGSELADEQAARDEASLTMAELAKEYIAGSPLQKNVTMWVRNEQGEAVLQLSLTFATQIPKGVSSHF
ncbi:hypothetical protein [Devosia sp. 919]|uniref:DUF6894 family protein n=1 Tax=Devosia sp. 919 TaxID=2726065 RepID=UPI001556B07C|nr:hypothetical protein [Devosia sp. 919]